MGSVELAHQPLIATATTALKAWNLLVSTYANPTRGHIKQLRNQIKRSVKGKSTIDEYMQQNKAKVDALALLGSPFDEEDLTDVVLDGLSDDYKAIIEAIHDRDTPISFTELHEKLINRELAINTVAPSPLRAPITAHQAQSRNSNWRNNTNNNNHHGGNGSRQNNNDQRYSRP